MLQDSSQLDNIFCLLMKALDYSSQTCLGFLIKQISSDFIIWEKPLYLIHKSSQKDLPLVATSKEETCLIQAVLIKFRCISDSVNFPPSCPEGSLRTAIPSVTPKERKHAWLAWTWKTFKCLIFMSWWKFLNGLESFLFWTYVYWISFSSKAVTQKRKGISHWKVNCITFRYTCIYTAFGKGQVGFWLIVNTGTYLEVVYIYIHHQK